MNNKETSFISAVVYLHNNEKDAAEFLKILYDNLNEKFEKFEIICVNDASSDKTAQIVETYAKNLHNAMVSIINMGFYQGLELSMNAGVDLSIGDFVYEFDSIYADYPPSLLSDVYQRALEGFDIVSAAPDKRMRLSSSIFYAIFNRASNNQKSLCSERFRILSRRAINRVHAKNKTVPYRKAVYASCGLKTDNLNYTPLKQIPYHVNAKERKEIAMDAIILFTDFIYKCTFAMTILMMVVALSVGIYTMVIFFTGKPIEGWTTTMLFLAVGFFGIFAILAAIIKYLSVILNLIFKNMQYTIESIGKISK